MAAVFRIAAVLSAALLFTGAAAAALPFGTVAVVGDAALDRVRGGFTSPDSGLHVTFGVVQRAVYVDGQPAPATALPTGGALLLVQRGDGNRVVGTGLEAAAAATTVVQNTLDNQRLQVVTTIDVQTDGLRVSRGLALRAAVGLGIAASLRR